MRIEVHPGDPVRLTAVTIKITGPGEEDAALGEAVRNCPLRSGMRLDHRQYEEARDSLISVAIENGYLKVPERPGLGSDLIETELRKHPPASYPGAR